MLNILQNLGKNNRFFFSPVDKAVSFYLADKIIKPMSLLGHKVFIMLLLLILHKDN